MRSYKGGKDMRTCVVLMCMFLLRVVHAQDLWPALDKPAKKIGGGQDDGALVVGIETYLSLPPIEGAKANAEAFYDYFVKTLGVPVERARLLVDGDATDAEIRTEAKRIASETKGTMWFVFIGHGAPDVKTKEGLLVGYDAKGDIEIIGQRSILQSELFEILKKSKAKHIVVVLDACFSGRTPEGEPLIKNVQPFTVVQEKGLDDERFVVLTATQKEQAASPLPGAERPAFSYLVLGGIRGWADEN